MPSQLHRSQVLHAIISTYIHDAFFSSLAQQSDRTSKFRPYSSLALYRARYSCAVTMVVGPPSQMAEPSFRHMHDIPS